ncbi:glycosyltransferase involved in cell wall biosynthesis [Mycoplana sp. BE70]|uniref:glycosyl transferase n=1 Tax=Mycoplana sp. BE70 TaxID=2817775 RepID=UPI002863550A|nr:glycosyl transferase [Mycoplana sp. BE70]MDR6756200.1 glycosyltransferase involved in cell wall biosynthesis [Mycoplana sp. BE70]
MLTVLIECHNDEPELAQTLSALIPGAVEGLVRDVIVLDHGSSDGSAKVADAAGCTFLTRWDLHEVVSSARGEWLLLLEPGARPLNGWIDAVGEYIGTSQAPARFAGSRNHRRPFPRRLLGRRTALEQGLLLSKRQGIALAAPNASLAGIATGVAARQLVAEIVPAWAVRAMQQKVGA